MVSKPLLFFSDSAGLWFGKGKPHFATFMKPFCQSIRNLYTEGEVFPVTILIINDSPGKHYNLEMA